MSGMTDLRGLLASMSPTLSAESYVFVSLREPWGSLLEMRPWAMMAELEGTTLIVTKESADRHRLRYESAFRRISLTVHSSLEAVGLTARVAGKLAEEGISANVVAAYFHDHIFVPEEAADRAMRALRELGEDSKT